METLAGSTLLLLSEQIPGQKSWRFVNLSTFFFTFWGVGEEEWMVWGQKTASQMPVAPRIAVHS